MYLYMIVVSSLVISQNLWFHVWRCFVLQLQFAHLLYVVLINAFSGTVFVALLSGPRLAG